MNVQQRIDYLGELADGWLDGEGLAPTQVALRRALAIAEACEAGGRRPQIAPTPEGGVSLDLVPIRTAAS